MEITQSWMLNGLSFTPFCFQIVQNYDFQRTFKVDFEMNNPPILAPNV